MIGYSDHQPDKHLLEPKAGRPEHSCAPPGQSYHLGMEPYPHVPENQGYSYPPRADSLNTGLRVDVLILAWLSWR